jgi:hypothetical protein
MSRKKNSESAAHHNRSRQLRRNLFTIRQDDSSQRLPIEIQSINFSQSFRSVIAGLGFSSPHLHEHHPNQNQSHAQPNP